MVLEVNLVVARICLGIYFYERDEMALDSTHGMKKRDLLRLSCSSYWAALLPTILDSTLR